MNDDDQSKQDAHQAMQTRIIARLMDDPQTLDDILTRLKDGRMVEYGTLDD